MESVIEIQNTHGSFFSTFDKTSDVNIKSSTLTKIQRWIQELQQSEQSIANNRKVFDGYKVQIKKMGRSNHVTVTDDDSYAKLPLEDFMVL